MTKQINENQPQIDKYKIILGRFTAELEGALDREARTLITTEAEIHDVSKPTNNDGSYNLVYKAKVVGTTIVKQGDKKPQICKSKRSASQKWRFVLQGIEPSEEFYQAMMNKMLANPQKVVDFLYTL